MNHKSVLPPQATFKRPFTPPLWLRNAHIQTIGSSLFTRAPDISTGRRIELVTAENVKLEAFMHGEDNPGRQVILIHGWLGSADSSYVLTAAADLLASPGARDDEAVQRLLAAEAEWAEKHTPHLPVEPPEP